MSAAYEGHQLAVAVADLLADPDAAGLPVHQPWWRQSLALGVPGIALLHVELAAAGLRPWQRAHHWLTAATSRPVTSGAHSHPFHGAPALAHVLACAAARQPGAYADALDGPDKAITADARRRVAAAHARIDAGKLPALAEFDAIRGLTGIGAYLLHRAAAGQELRAVLEYLVRLTQPLHRPGEVLPGWWAGSGPSGRPDARFPGGHGNNGMAHGIAGPMTLLALAALRGVVVDGQLAAIGTICSWLDRWRSETDAGPIWPYWITRPQLQANRAEVHRRQRPSWCYGTTGLARAQQLAALALNDPVRRTIAECALVRALADPQQLAATTDPSLCHGYAGLAHIARRAADDALPEVAARLNALVPRLLDMIDKEGAGPRRTAAALIAKAAGPGFLEGAAGVALAALSCRTAAVSNSSWDSCLLTARPTHPLT
ncbi:lanthionine synthetase C family protein [Micromonospora narathiwatensis]|uniref:Lanthionine synthetase C-like protein n=1 Tax=Micromonospora narathiwatensis TaxID=299146 RepID=A0A1A8Z974_9ACTN|nr:lanthionine synthetase C family protein [Micromonospora narathiwatensis]SBT40509.1 Lanthionine synthetase C-like protein [Micromonospora narathiwatensis]